MKTEITDAEIQSYAKAAGWGGMLPFWNELSMWRDAVENEMSEGGSLEDGMKKAYDKFYECRESMARIESAKFQSRTSAMSDRAADVHARNWN